MKSSDLARDSCDGGGTGESRLDGRRIGRDVAPLIVQMYFIVEVDSE